MKNKAIFLDRDGTVTLAGDHIHKIEDFGFIQGAVEGLKKLQGTDYKLIIITNQVGIGRGYYTEEVYHNFQLKLRQELNKQGIFITGEYFCPHHPEKGIEKYKIDCNCRKPKTGMLEQASIDFDLDLSQSWMIGDNLTDIQAGNSAGCKTIHVLTGEFKEPVKEADFVAKDLIEAANYIITEDENK